MRIKTRFQLVRHLALAGSAAFCVLAGGLCAAAEPVRICAFQADVTPPLGAPLCYAAVPPASEIVDPLSARGIVILGAGQPIVLCAVDWVGISNTAHDEFREKLAAAAGTSLERVAVHCVHQHDAPGCDYLADELAADAGLGNRIFDVGSTRQALRNMTDALSVSLRSPRTVTHVGYGRGRVEKVASNRRVMGPDGKVRAIRWSSVTDPELHAAPEGTIDPFVHLVSFWNGDTPLATLSYYATHPQSHYGKGGVSCDFPGLARNALDREQPGVAHIHFNGAAGNVTAGKYNDGSPENRPVLADRVAAGMRAAFDATRKMPLSAADIAWDVRPVALPPAEWLDRDKLRATIANEAGPIPERLRSAWQLAWLERCREGRTIDIGRLRLGSIDILHMPGELFVEYQLAAQALRPESHVVMAAYGDGGPGYIGQAESYSQGGYETGYASLVSPEVEPVLMQALRELLQ